MASLAIALWHDTRHEGTSAGSPECLRISLSSVVNRAIILFAVVSDAEATYFDDRIACSPSTSEGQSVSRALV
jgi:hypothetical protein